MTTPQLLLLVEAFLVEHRISAAHFSRRATGGSHKSLVTHMRSGGSVTLETAAKVLDFMSSERARRNEAA